MSQTPEAPQRNAQSARERVALLAALGGIAVVTLALAALSAFDRVDGQTVTTLHSQVRDAISSAYFATMLSPLLVAIVSFLRRRWVIGTIALFWVPALFVGTVFIYFATNPAPYSFDSPVRASDGQTYHFGESSFLQGQLLGLFRETEADAFTVTGQRVVMTNGDNPRMSGEIVRPVGDVRENHHNQVYLSPNGNVVVGNRHGNCAFLAYDVTTGERWNHSEMFGADDDTTTHAVNTLSPFVLIGPDDELHPEDVNELLDPAANCSNSGFEHLPESVIRDALRHPNERVREIARQLEASSSDGP